MCYSTSWPRQGLGSVFIVKGRISLRTKTFHPLFWVFKEERKWKETEVPSYTLSIQASISVTLDKTVHLGKKQSRMQGEAGGHIAEDICVDGNKVT